MSHPFHAKGMVLRLTMSYPFYTKGLTLRLTMSYPFHTKGLTLRLTMSHPFHTKQLMLRLTMSHPFNTKGSTLRLTMSHPFSQFYQLLQQHTMADLNGIKQGLTEQLSYCLSRYRSITQTKQGSKSTEQTTSVMTIISILV